MSYEKEIALAKERLTNFLNEKSLDFEEKPNEKGVEFILNTPSSNVVYPLSIWITDEVTIYLDHHHSHMWCPEYDDFEELKKTEDLLADIIDEEKVVINYFKKNNFRWSMFCRSNEVDDLIKKPKPLIVRVWHLLGFGSDKVTIRSWGGAHDREIDI